MSKSFFKLLTLLSLLFVASSVFAQKAKKYPIYFKSVKISKVDEEKALALDHFASFLLEVGMYETTTTISDKRYSSSLDGHLSYNGQSASVAIIFDNQSFTSYVLVLKDSRKPSDPIPVYFTDPRALFGIDEETIFKNKKAPILELNPELNSYHLRDYREDAPSDEAKLIISWAILGLEPNRQTRQELRERIEESLVNEQARSLALKIVEAEFSDDLDFLNRLEKDYISSNSTISLEFKRDLSLILSRAGILTSGVFEILRYTALHDTRSSIQKEALWVLEKSLTEENIKTIIKVMADADNSVSKAAYNILDGKKLNAKIIPTLTEVFSSSENSRIKMNLLNIIAQNQNERDAVKALIPGLSDTNYEVRKKSFQLLSELPMYGDVIYLLSEIFEESSSGTIKIQVLELLALNQDQHTAAKAIIPGLADGSSDVRKRAFQLLTTLPMGQDLIPLLSAVLKQASSGSNKIQVLELLALNQNQQTAVKAIIPGLADDSSDVRKRAFQLLTTLPMGQDVIPLLSEIFEESSSGTIKIQVLELLALNQDQNNAVKLMIKALKDSNSSVYKSTQKLLKESKHLGEDNIDELADAFKSDASSVRVFVAEILGKISTQKSLDALLDQLEKETNSKVRSTLVEAIKSVRKNLR